MKKFFSFFLVLAILMTFSGCSKSKESSTSIESAHIQLGSADIDLAEDFSEIFCLDKNAERHLVFGKLKSGEYGGCITDDQYKEEKAFRFIANENEKARAASLMNGDGISVITTMDSETMIYVLDSGSNVEHKYELGEVISPDDYYMEFLCFEDGFYINVARRKLVYVDIMGNLKGEVKTDGRNICGITTDRDGKPCVLLNDEEKMNIGKLVGCEIADEMSCDELGTGINAICSGEGEYRIVLVTISGLYALKEDEWLKLSDFSDNDFPIHNIYDVDTISDNEFVVLLNSGGKETELRRLYKRELSEIKQKKTIKVALTSGGNIDPYTPQIKKYNSENDEYKIEFVDYYTDSQEDTFNRLRLDIISGECPDIIIFSDYMTVESFGTEEYIFVDLYSLIDRDNEIGRDDFVDGFLESMETKGRLLQITPTFIIRTNMIKNKFANGLSSWDTEEFKEICQNMPENMDFSVEARSRTKYNMFNDLVSYGQFIDKDNAECHFDSDEFISIIKLINDLNIGVSADEASRADKLMVAGTMIEAFRNDEVLIQRSRINGYRDLKIYQQVYSGEECTFIGFPSEKRLNAVCHPAQTFGIMANSDNIDGAWDFLKYYMFGEESLSDAHFIGFSGLKKVLKQQLLVECSDQSDITEEASDNEEDIYYVPGGVGITEVQMHPFSEKEAAEIEKFVCESLKDPEYLDYNIESILSEELNHYFEGECSAEAAAKMIQNRVSIYLSEQS